MSGTRNFVVAFMIALLTLIVLTQCFPRYEMALEMKDDYTYVYRLDRRTGQICRYLQDGSCVAFKRRCAFENQL